MAEGSGHKPSKDNVISQQLVQNTYSRLKLKYASGLCEKWVEDTQPSKHVFEALSIAAFLIELWRSMYGIVPAEEREGLDKEETASSFVDIACGNGVLVYVLLMEGYQGWGFDACRRKTWTIFPESVQERLREEVYIPKPFADALSDSGTKKHMLDIGVKTHTGMFPKDAFIISHHADALTIWTPLMAALASPQSPLPFLAVPCCSHSLSGARYRYPPPKENATKPENEPNVEVAQNPQPASGDLRALRSAKLDAQTDAGMNKSMYGSLTAKAMRVTEEVGYEVEKTVLQIPSTRNLGVVGGRRRTTGNWNRKPSALASGDSLDRGSWDTVVEKVSEIVQRECSREGGVETAAKIWMGIGS